MAISKIEPSKFVDSLGFPLLKAEGSSELSSAYSIRLNDKEIYDKSLIFTAFTLEAQLTYREYEIINRTDVRDHFWAFGFGGKNDATSVTTQHYTPSTAKKYETPYSLYVHATNSYLRMSGKIIAGFLRDYSIESYNNNYYRLRPNNRWNQDIVALVYDRTVQNSERTGYTVISPGPDGVFELPYDAYKVVTFYYAPDGKIEWEGGSQHINYFPIYTDHIAGLETTTVTRSLTVNSMRKLRDYLYVSFTSDDKGIFQLYIDGVDRTSACFITRISGSGSNVNYALYIPFQYAFGSHNYTLSANSNIFTSFVSDVETTHLVFDDKHIYQANYVVKKEQYNSRGRTFSYNYTITAPTLSLNNDGTVLVWDSIPEADRYDIYGGDFMYPSYIGSTTNTSYPIPNALLGPGDIEFYVRARKDSASSDLSNRVRMQIALCGTPSIQWTDSITSEFSISNLTNASGWLTMYGPYVSTDSAADREYARKAASVTTQLFEQTTPGKYIIQAKPAGSMSESEGLYTIYYSNYYQGGQLKEVRSNPIYYNFVKLIAPVISIDPSTRVVTWSAITDAVGYDVYINEEKVTRVTETSYTVTGEYDNATLYVIAIAKDSSYTATDLFKYMNSDSSNVVVFGNLKSPTLSVNANVLSWTTSPNADSYMIYMNGNPYYETNLNTYTVVSYVPGVFRFQVEARSNAGIVSSVLSNTVTINFTRLNAPMIRLDESGQVVTILDDNAANYPDLDPSTIKYLIDVNGTEQTTLEPSYTITTKGTLNIRVRVDSDDPIFIKSLYSNKLNLYKNPESSYVLQVKDKHGYEDIYPIQVPITANFTIDDSFDTANVVLKLNNIATPFEPNTECIIICNNSDGSGSLNDDINNWRMYIEEDRVTEVQQGSTIKYKHNITLIEKTKELEYVIMPDLTVTQPLEYIDAVYDKSFATANYGNYYLFNECKYSIAYEVGYQKLLRMQLINDNNGELRITEFPKKFFSKASVKLPRMNISSVKTQTSIYTSIEAQIKDAENYENFEQKWWIRKRTPTSVEFSWQQAKNYAMTHTPTFIGNSADEAPVYTFTDDGTYDIIFYCDGFYDETLERKIELLSTTKATNEPIYMDIRDDFNNIPCYILWSGIVVNSELGQSKTEAVYVDKVLQKIINAVEPLTFKTGDIQATKYTIDPEIMNYVQNFISPEFTWSGGKSLYEILADVGRVFYGIPRLLNNNVITFDILNVNRGTKLITQASFSEKASSMDNHSTTFISDISNLISETASEWYPSKDNWISVRSTDESNAYVLRSNCGLVLPKPIFQLKDIRMAMIDSNGNIINASSIMDYITEVTLFETIPATVTGKGKTLYWIKGDNKIYNMGACAAKTENEEIFGLSSERYVIQNIAQDLFGVISADPQNLIFQVEYIPYTDTRVVIEQANIAGLSNYCAKSFNQDTNTVSDGKFGASTQTQIERLGNNSITRSYKFQSIMDCPHLGNTIYFDGYIYYADSITYSLFDNYVGVNVTFSKNFNKINERIGTDAEYRQFEIFADHYVRRDININNYCYISTNEYSDCDTSTMSNTYYSLPSILLNALNAKQYNKPESFYITSNSISNNNIIPTKYTDYNEDIKNTTGMLIPANLYTFKNSILLTGGMKDNFSAGINAMETSPYSGADKYVQKDVRYVDDKGEAEVINICLGTLQSNNLYLDSLKKGFRSLPALSYTRSPVPYMMKENSPYSNPLLYKQFYIQKDNREALNFNYQLHFQTFDKTIFIHRGLVKNLFKIGSTALVEPLNVVFSRDTLNTQETLRGQDYTYFGTPTVTLGTRANVIKVGGMSVTNSGYKSWALVWPDTGEILISGTIENTYIYQSVSMPDLYFNFSESKIDYKEQ